MMLAASCRFVLLMATAAITLPLPGTVKMADARLSEPTSDGDGNRISISAVGTTVTMTTGSVAAASSSSSFTTTTTGNIDHANDRMLFDLVPPFEIYNDQCANYCDSYDDFGASGGGGGGSSFFSDMNGGYQSGNNDDINACPKCHEKYTPCNFCCFDGASSLKMIYFGCPGDLTFVPFFLNDGECDDVEVPDFTTDADVFDDGITVPAFIDCECYDRLVHPTTAGEIVPITEECEVYGSLALGGPFAGGNDDYSTDDATDDDYDDDGDYWTGENYFEVCVVSLTIVEGTGFVVDLTKPLPSILGLKHTPIEHDDELVNPQVTYFDTTCSLDLKDPDDFDDDYDGYWPYEGNYYPLFPGYGKFAGTCPTKGFIDFEHDGAHPLPESIDHFHGYPPSTTFFYQVR
jgi:hypothetical protein